LFASVSYAIFYSFQSTFFYLIFFLIGPDHWRGRGRGLVPVQSTAVEHIGAAQQQLPTPPRAQQSFNGQQQQPQCSLEPPVQEMQLMSLGGAAKSALRPPPRRGEGTLGRKISLSANHFAVLIKNPSVFHYDVDLNPVPPSALFRYKKLLEYFYSFFEILRYLKPE